MSGEYRRISRANSGVTPTARASTRSSIDAAEAGRLHLRGCSCRRARRPSSRSGGRPRNRPRRPRRLRQRRRVRSARRQRAVDAPGTAWAIGLRGDRADRGRWLPRRARSPGSRGFAAGSSAASGPATPTTTTRHSATQPMSAGRRARLPSSTRVIRRLSESFAGATPCAASSSAWLSCRAALTSSEA